MGDVAVLDETKDVGATNRRQLAALYCGATSGFEVNTVIFATTLVFTIAKIEEQNSDSLHEWLCKSVL